MYTMSSVLEQEVFIGFCLAIFTRKMAEFAESGGPVDFGTWLWNYTFDVIGELFFGHHFGFMKEDHDYQGWMETLENLFPVIVTTGLLPKYLRSAVFPIGLLDSNFRKGLPGLRTLTQAAIDGIEQRKAQIDRGELDIRVIGDVAVIV